MKKMFKNIALALAFVVGIGIIAAPKAHAQFGDPWRTCDYDEILLDTFNSYQTDPNQFLTIISIAETGMVVPGTSWELLLYSGMSSAGPFTFYCVSV